MRKPLAMSLQRWKQQGWTANGLTQRSHLYFVHKPAVVMMVLQAGVRDLHVGLDIFTASEDPPNPITGLRSTEETEGSSVISFQRNKGLGPTVVTF